MGSSRIARKLNRVVLAGVIGTAFAATAYFIAAERAEERETLESYGSQIAALLASSAELGLYTNDTEALGRVAADAVGRSDVARARVLGTDEKPIVETYSEGAAPRREAHLIVVRAPVRARGFSGVEDDPLFGGSEPELLGYVELGLSSERSEREGFERSFVALGITALIGALATAGTALVMRRMARPIVELSAAAHRIADGDLDGGVDGAASDDEVGDLSQSFARMVERLRESRRALQAHQEDLERKVADRTAELEQRTLEAEEANRVKTQFLANMSHELRTPLNAVLGMNELLLYSPLEPEQRHFAQTIESSGRHLLAIINEVLDFSKVQAGRVDVELAPCDLHALLRELADLLDVRAKAKGIELRLYIEGGVPRVVITDAVRVRQVLTNLLGNAVKFTEDGSVTLRALPGAGPGSLRLEVDDTGVGIPESLQARVFEAFTQVDGSLTRRHEGTGLGLAIAKHVTTALGGQIGVTSRVGHGSQFWLELPLTEASPAQLAALDAAAQRNIDAGLPTNLGLHVLVAEDNPINQRFALAVLKRLGCEARAVGDGAEAIAALSALQFDVVLMDGQMPNVDGYEAARRIREIEARDQRKPIPIIALTAHAFAADRERALASGMNDHVAKPFTIAALAAALTKQCSDRRIADHTAQPDPPEQAAPRVIDESALEELRALEDDDDPNFVREMILDFLESSQTLASDIRAALAQEERDRARIAAHTLKSSSARLGASQVSAVAKQIEADCRSGAALQALRPKVDELQRDLQAAQGRLRELLPEAKKRPLP